MLLSLNFYDKILGLFLQHLTDLLNTLPFCILTLECLMVLPHLYHSWYCTVFWLILCQLSLNNQLETLFFKRNIQIYGERDRLQDWALRDFTVKRSRGWCEFSQFYRSGSNKCLEPCAHLKLLQLFRNRFFLESLPEMEPDWCIKTHFFKKRVNNCLLTIGRDHTQNKAAVYSVKDI